LRCTTISCKNSLGTFANIAQTAPWIARQMLLNRAFHASSRTVAACSLVTTKSTSRNILKLLGVPYTQKYRCVLTSKSCTQHRTSLTYASGGKYTPPHVPSKVTADNECPAFLSQYLFVAINSNVAESSIVVGRYTTSSCLIRRFKQI